VTVSDPDTRQAIDKLAGCYSTTPSVRLDCKQIDDDHQRNAPTTGTSRRIS